ncbi:conserved hypothetical protein [Rhodoferax sp. OV413]|uniref:ferritin-like domain-containing protein n=1 Tax=Rhodoferax sp. OV413 TaxID=1855285 RepID=UPI000883DCC2|nr:PA2169 family four-helix-bundle protein [Rhodoferax sp. OV413]SDO26395.1 conserved hypothetical protein [Rhodoferax sp. OV413]
MLNEKDSNLDPISGEPGAHPVGTGLGATGGAVAGAAVGAMGGPVGAAIGGVAGAVVGGLAGKAGAEAVNPTAEEAYWRERYQDEPYYEAGRTYDDYGPAYALGWSGGNLYGSEFSAVEPELARRWEEQRGRSSLAWPHARYATRAAWDRINEGQLADTAEPLDNDDVIDVLNDLVETCHDGEYGFKACMERTETAQLKSTFEQRMRDCASSAAELASEVLRLGGVPEDGGTVSGAAHRGWVAVKGMLTSDSDLAVLEECERGEDTALARYRRALKQALPADVRSLVERQMQGVQKNHDLVKALRDEYRLRS